MDQTPEISESDFRKRRVAAFCIDALLVIILTRILYTIIGIVQWYFRTGGIGIGQLHAYRPEVWYLHILFIITVGIIYFTLTTYAWKGQTIGKNIMKLRVIRLGGERVTMLRAALRTLAYSATVVLFIGHLVRRGQNAHEIPMHDRIAGTKLIYDPSRQPPPPKPKKSKFKKRKSLLH